MAEIINLRQAKRRLARDAAAQAAQENRTRHGRTKAERAALQREAEAARRLLDGAELDKPNAR